MLLRTVAALSICALQPGWAAAAEGAAPDTASARVPGTAPAPVRIEARSADLLAVGIVRADSMAVHLSRILDNAPVRDAQLTVVLRGVEHPTRAEADGSYTLRTPDLSLPGQAAVEFDVRQAGALTRMKGAFDNAPAGDIKDTNTARQLGWWVLNFAVCIGFLLLLSRRRKTAAAPR